MDETDFWYSSSDADTHLIAEKKMGDLPGPEWIAFGDTKFSRMLFLLHHEDDEQPDTYVDRPYMTVFGFGRSEKEKYLDTPQTFSIGLVESSTYGEVEESVKSILR